MNGLDFSIQNLEANGLANYLDVYAELFRPIRSLYDPCF